MAERGIEVAKTAGVMRFSFGIGSDFFPEIAKLRAARLLWATIMKGWGAGQGDAAVMKIHSVTGRWNKALYDPYVNMLRTQTEAMSAVIGGADSLTVEPFDIVFRRPDDFSERIARNQQLLLMEERATIARELHDSLAQVLSYLRIQLTLLKLVKLFLQ